MIDVLVIGARGRMGTLVSTTVAGQSDMRLAGLVDPAFRDGEPAAAPTFTDLDTALTQLSPTVAVEFSTPASVFGNCRRTLAAGVNTVVGATGLTGEQIAELEQLAADHSAGLFIAPNFALGAVLLMRFAAEAARHYAHAEIIELHHEKKVDAPSGTALRTAMLMGSTEGTALEPADVGQASRGLSVDGIPVHSVRLPGLVAHEEVLFGGTGELLTLRHDSLSHESFMPGVLLAIRKTAALSGTVIGLEHLLD
jgi:4-hydroxy-tetrahydrodipicolinate reductase